MMDDEFELIQIKAPKGFVKDLDIWRMELSKKTEIPISRPVALHLLKPAINEINYNINKKTNHKNLLFEFDINLRRRR